MTILKPKNKNRHLWFFLTIAALFVLSGVVYVFEYNALVDVRAEIEKAENDIAAGTNLKAELAKKLFEITDPNNLNAFAEENLLIIEERPEYIGYENAESVASLRK